MTPESRKKHFWTERAGYKGRESFIGALLLQKADTQHPPSSQPTHLSLGMVPPILHLPFQCLPRFYSRVHQGDPFSARVALAKPLLQALLYWHQLWFHFCTRERERESNHFSDCLPQCLSLDSLLYATHGARLWSVSKISAL